jgi:hypothetical protein
VIDHRLAAKAAELAQQVRVAYEPGQESVEPSQAQVAENLHGMVQPTVRHALTPQAPPYQSQQD